MSMVVVRGLTVRMLVVALAVAVGLWAREASVSGSSYAELVRESFRLTFETPSIEFAHEEDESRFHSDFRDEAGGGLEWLADRIQLVLEARDPSVISLGSFDPALPEVTAWLAPGEEGSLEQAPAGPVRYLVPLGVGGEGAMHVPAMTIVALELALENRPPREALQALIEALEAAVAAPEPTAP